MRDGPAALGWLGASWVAGLLAAQGLTVGSWQAPLALAVFGAGALAVLWGMMPAREAVHARTVALALQGVVFAAGASTGPPAPPTRDVIPPSGVARVSAVVEDTRAGLDGEMQSVLRVLEGARLEDGAPIARGTRLRAGPAALPLAARVQLVAKIAPRAPFRNLSPHPRAPVHLEVQGQAFVQDARAVRVIDAPWFASWIDRARVHVRARLDATLSEPAAGIARALVLGDDAAVAEEDQADVRAAGLLHVFAVSGLHVAILAGLCVAALERVLLLVYAFAARFEARRLACALGAPLALAYADFAGGAPSAWRAAITAALSWVLVAIGRRPDARATTAASALVLSALEPSEALRPAFLLSIAATAAIISGPRLHATDLASWLRAAFVLSLRAWAATAPIVLWCFGGVPLLGLLANVVLLPFGSLLLVQISALHALLATFTPWWDLSGALFTAVSGAFLTACAVFAKIWPAMQWPPPDVWQGLVIAATALVLLRVRSARACIIVLALASLTLIGLELRLRALERPIGRLRVSFLDVGQGDAALIDLPDGRAMLIDAGGNPGGGADPGRAVLTPLLQARRRARIDVAVLTHPHPDHYGGLRALAGAVPITELWDTGQAEGERDLQTASGDASELLARVRAAGGVVLAPAQLCDRPMVAGGAWIYVLAPCPRYDSAYDPNDNSLVIRIEYGRRSLLFAGDAEAHAEGVLLEHPERLPADVLKIAHHGSRTSSGPEFLHAVAPRLAVISAGAGNRFGHPHADVVERLQASVPHVLSLADTGGAIVETDGQAMHVRTWSGQRFDL